MKNIIIGFLFISTSVFSQQFKFDIHNTSLDEYLKTEESLGSEKIPTTSNHVSFGGSAQPIKYLRKEKVIPDLTVFYFFKKADSTMSYILYEWDIRNFEKTPNNPQNKKVQNAFINKYQKLEKIIDKEIGAGKLKEDFTKLKEINTEKGLNKHKIWNPNDSTEIEMYLRLRNFYEKKQIATTPTIHRIRLYVRNTKKEEKTTSKLNTNKIEKLELIVGDFFTVLNSNKLNESKEYLSELIKETTTDEQLTSLAEQINFNKTIEVIYSGVQIGSDGSNYNILQYKYSDDKSNPPKEMIKIIFDSNDKIVGIKPMKRNINN